MYMLSRLHDFVFRQGVESSCRSFGCGLTSKEKDSRGDHKAWMGVLMQCSCLHGKERLEGVGIKDLNAAAARQLGLTSEQHPVERICF